MPPSDRKTDSTRNFTGIALHLFPLGERSFARPMTRPFKPLAALPFICAFVGAQTAAPRVIEAPVFEVTTTRLTTTTASPTTTVNLSSETFQPDFALPALAAEIAGFTVGNNQSRSFTDTFAIRGLTNTPIFGAPAVTVYLDDLPLGSGFTFPSDLTGFTQAELLRGPGAGTRFGRSGPGGILLLSTPETGSQAGGSLTLSAGDYRHLAAAYTAHSARHAKGDAYVAATWSERDGYVTNTTLNEDVDYRETLTALARLRWRPTETLEITFLAQALQARDGAQPLVPLGGPYHAVQRSAEGVTEMGSFHAALTAAFDLASGRLTATTGYTDWDMGPYSNTLDFGFAELGNGSTLRQQNLSEEIIFTSAPGADLDWRIGVFLNEGQTNGGFVRQFGGFTFEESTYQFDVTDLAIFGEATFAATDALDLTLGLRAVSTEMDSARTEIVPAPGVTLATHESDALLPHLNVRYQVGLDTTAFANFAMGYKTGGFSAFTGNAALAPYDAEYTTAYEVGVTRASADGRYAATVRAYFYDIADYQIERSFATAPNGADDYLVVNADSAESIGGEIELSWRPAAGLFLAVAYGLTDTTLSNFIDPYSGDVFSGNRVPYVPSHDLHLRAHYQHHSGFYVGVNLTTLGRTYYTEAEDPTFAQSAYTLLDARLGYATDRYRIGLSGRNLTDEGYYSAITPGTFHGTPGAPRTWVGELTLLF